MPRRKSTTRRRTTKKKAAGRRWVRHVAETSNAMDLPPRIFKGSARSIALGLKRSVMRSKRTKGTKFQSAMGMLNLYTNRAGRSLPARDRARLQAAKVELRKVFGRETKGPRRKPRSQPHDRRSGSFRSLFAGGGDASIDRHAVTRRRLVPTSPA